MAGFADGKVTIKAFIEANWGGAPVAWQNRGAGARPVDANGQPTSWIYCEIIATTSRGSRFGSTGKRVKTDQGLVAAHCFVPINSGDEVAEQMAKDFGAMLELRSIGAPPAPRMEAAQPGGGGSGDDDGAYFRVSVTVPWSINYAA